MLNKIKQDSYCARRIEFEKVEKIADIWHKVKQDHRYLESVLLHEYLETNVKLTRTERQVAKDCIKMVGDFYQKAQYESELLFRDKKPKEEKPQSLKYRRD